MKMDGKTKIGIVGYGIVGKALANGFAQKDHEVFLNEIFPHEGFGDTLIWFWTKKQLAEQCDLIFVCVPTPTKPNGEADLSNLETVLQEFNSFPASPPIVIKSTVPPGTTDHFIRKYPNLLFAVNPEFLTAKNALEDVGVPAAAEN